MKIVIKLDIKLFLIIWVPLRRGEFTFGFAGGIYDKDTKLTRFGEGALEQLQRENDTSHKELCRTRRKGEEDYDSESGRWTSKEPLGVAGSRSFRFKGQARDILETNEVANFYVYVRNDGVNYVDLDGLKIILFNHSNLNQFELDMFLNDIASHSDFLNYIINELKDSDIIIAITNDLKKKPMNYCFELIDNIIFINFANVSLYNDGVVMTPLELLTHELIHAWQYLHILLLSRYSAEREAIYYQNNIRNKRGDSPRKRYGKWRFP